MDKKLIMAVAGAGKTTYLIDQLNEDKNFLIITYTKNNYESLREAVIRKFNYIPSNIKIYTYFTFLYNFCFRPFEKNTNSKGLEYGLIAERRANSSELMYYMNRYTMKMYAPRLSKLCKNSINDKVKSRIEKYFNFLFIDEIQDFAGNDFNFILELTKCNLNILYVGDFYQHTFDTSRDGNTNVNLFEDYNKYINKIKGEELQVDSTTLIKSRRCTKNVCNFVRDKLNINIYSYEQRESTVKEITDKSEIDKIMRDDKIVKLFYQNSRKFIGNTENWGNSKGKTYDNVCVILNPNSYKLFKQEQLDSMAPSTKNKFYVACTRSRNNLFFIQEKDIKQYNKK